LRPSLRSSEARQSRQFSPSNLTFRAVVNAPLRPTVARLAAFSLHPNDARWSAASSQQTASRRQRRIFPNGRSPSIADCRSSNFGYGFSAAGVWLRHSGSATRISANNGQHLTGCMTYSIWWSKTEEKVRLGRVKSAECAWLYRRRCRTHRSLWAFISHHACPPRGSGRALGKEIRRS
jgi:hypothetical protein